MSTRQGRRFMFKATCRFHWHWRRLRKLRNCTIKQQTMGVIDSDSTTNDHVHRMHVICSTIGLVSASFTISEGISSHSVSDILIAYKNWAL